MIRVIQVFRVLRARAWLVALALVGVSMAGAAIRAQPPGPASDSVPPAEIQRLFDAYALVQAQAQLKLSDEQYTPFLARYKALQDIRRRFQNQRGRIIQDLRRLSMDDAKSDDGQVRERIKAFQDLEVQAA